MFTNWDILIIVVYAIHYSHSPLCRAFSNEIKRRALRSSPVDKLSSSVHNVSHSLLLFAFHQVGKMKFMLNFIRARVRRASTADICYLVVCTTVFDLIRIFFAFAKNFTSFICVHWNANQDLFKCFLVAQRVKSTILLLANGVLMRWSFESAHMSSLSYESSCNDFIREIPKSSNNDEMTNK